MKKYILLAAMAMSCLPVGTAMADHDVRRIEIGVQSCEVRTIDDDGRISIYAAATAKPGCSKKLPYGKTAVITRITLNPTWGPTENMKADARKKNEPVPKVVPPGKDNPLGFGKMYFSYDGNPSVYGIHHTNKEWCVRNDRKNHVTSGCVRLKRNDFIEIAGTILKQNGRNPDSLIALAEKYPGKSIVINLHDRPTATYLEK